MTRYTLGKRHKLCSHTAVDRLFDGREGVKSALAYPLRAVWRENAERVTGDSVQFLITVPKKRLRHAVERVKMRRRVREAYRLSRHQYVPDASDDVTATDVAFIYVANGLMSYRSVERSVNRLLSKIFPVSQAQQPASDETSA